MLFNVIISRSSRCWSTMLWLYPGVYEVCASSMILMIRIASPQSLIFQFLCSLSNYGLYYFYYIFLFRSVAVEIGWFFYYLFISFTQIASKFQFSTLLLEYYLLHFWTSYLEIMSFVSLSVYFILSIPIFFLGYILLF